MFAPIENFEIDRREQNVMISKNNQKKSKKKSTKTTKSYGSNRGYTVSNIRRQCLHIQRDSLTFFYILVTFDTKRIDLISRKTQQCAKSIMLIG